MGKAGRGTGTLFHSPIASYGIHPATVALHAKGDNPLQCSSFHVVSCAVLRWGCITQASRLAVLYFVLCIVQERKVAWERLSCLYYGSSRARVVALISGAEL